MADTKCIRVEVKLQLFGERLVTPVSSVKSGGSALGATRYFVRLDRSLPLSNFPVKLLKNGELAHEQLTDANGQACFDGLEDAPYTVSVDQWFSEDRDRYPELTLAYLEYHFDGSSSESGQLEVQPGDGQCGGDVTRCAHLTAYYEIEPAAFGLDALNALNELHEIRMAVRSLVDFSSSAAPSPVIGRGGVAGVRDTGGRLGDVFASFLGASRATSDVNTVLSALERSFEETEPGKFTYNPRARVFEPRVGAIRLTGNQARLYERTKIFYDDVLKRLPLLEPATEGADVERVSALKAIIRNLLEGLIAEFGRDDEPRKALVDASFESLSDVVQELRDALEYGDPEEFIDVEDEEQLTHLDVLEADIASIEKEWNDWQAASAPGLNLGSNLRELSQSLKQAAHAVLYIRSLLASLGTGLAGETLIDQKTDLTLNDVVDLVDQSVTVQWPALIVEGRRQGAIAMLPLARELRRLVNELAQRTTPPFDRPGMGPAFKELAGTLDEVVLYAQKVATGNDQV